MAVRNTKAAGRESEAIFFLDADSPSCSARGAWSEGGFMRFKKIIKLFENNCVSVFGMKGRGKDLLMSNVVWRRNLPYVCNIDYGKERYPFVYESINCGENTYDNFLNGDVFKYVFPYPDGTDVYISDAGIYFPAQYCNELNRKYPSLSVYQAICRHVGNSRFHVNSQALSRVWDKIREQSDVYIYCRRCIYLGGLVLQWVTIYDNYQSALERRKPLRLSVPMMASSEAKMNARIALDQYEAAHGLIRNRFLIYRNKSSYDTRQFKKILENGRDVEPDEKRYNKKEKVRKI